MEFNELGHINGKTFPLMSDSNLNPTAQPTQQK